MPKGIPKSPNNNAHRRGYGHPSMTPELHRERSSEGGTARIKSGRGHFWTPTEAKAWSIRAYLMALARGMRFGKTIAQLPLPPAIADMPTYEGATESPEEEEE